MDVTGPLGHGPIPVRPAGAHRGRHEVDHAGVVAVVKVLLLNASHEPLAVVTGRRALVLVVAGKAECVLERPTGALIRPCSAASAMSDRCCDPRREICDTL